jgi:hypothetical protein
MPYGTVNADTLVTSTSGGILGAGNASIMKNRIINGAMVISQRNGTSSVTPADGDYTLDRWAASVTQSSKFTVQQNAGSVTPPVGFSNYLGCTSSSAYSVGSGDYFAIQQKIEGFNFADCGWGTANAKTITISAWVYSSLTGTFGGSLVNSSLNRSYPFTYTISSANTWTQISVTIAGDTTGTWVGATNGVGVRVYFSLGAGSTYSGTAGAWNGNWNLSATGATSVVGTNGATFYITGVQLEVGSSATGYEYVNYQTSLANCQRYYQKSYEIGTVPATATGTGVTGSAGTQGATTGSEVNTGAMRYQVSMRTNPTVTIYDESGNAGKVNRVNAGVADNQNQTGVATGSRPSANSLYVYSSSGSTATGCFCHFVASAEL